MKMYSSSVYACGARAKDQDRYLVGAFEPD